MHAERLPVGRKRRRNHQPKDATTLWYRAKQGSEPRRTESPTPAERRTKERKRQRLVDGFICSGRTSTPRPCTVCDMSAGGSRIDIWGDDARPLQPGDRVTLYIPVDRKEVDAEVRWRRETAIGLKFTSSLRTPTRRYG